MAKQRYKRVQGGRLVRAVLWTPTFPCDSPTQRAEKSKLSTAARRIMNLRASWQKLKLLLAANFVGTDLHITLGYANAYLPDSRAAARERMRGFLSRLRAHRRARGQELRYVYVTESRHSAGRLHHHLVINSTGADFEVVRALWEWGTSIDFELVSKYGYDDLAQYLTKEAREGSGNPVGARTWVPSLNLRKPDAPPAEWVPTDMRLEPPPNAFVVMTEERRNAFGHYQYLEYILPEPPAERRARQRKAKKSSHACASISALEQGISSGGVE